MKNSNKINPASSGGVLDSAGRIYSTLLHSHSKLWSIRGRCRIKNNSGQGLLEALVAIFIILTAIIGTLTLVISSIQAGRISTDKLIASSLAREGIEIVRNVRDSNWVDPTILTSNWYDGIMVAGDNTAIPVIDEIPPTPGLPLAYQLEFFPDNFGDSGEDCCAGCSNDCTRIYRKDSLFFQRPKPDSGWQQTKFYRLLYINSICWDEDENERIVPRDSGNDCNTEFGGTYLEVGINVISEVRWPSPGSSASNVIAEERIYNWRP